MTLRTNGAILIPRWRAFIPCGQGLPAILKPSAWFANGCLWEKYNVVALDQIPESGVYGSIRGFGWSNAVTWDFAGHLGER
jgi:Trehalase